MSVRTLSMQKVIKVEGSDLEPEVANQLESVVVIDRLAMPDTFALVFRDPNRQILDKAGLDIGTKVEVLATRPGDDSPESLIKGEVTSIEAEYDALGTRAVVRGYDKSHRLAAGRKTATFLNVKYSDIVTTIAGDYGLTPDVDDSGGTVDHVLQANQSDLEFIYGLARKIGFDFRVDDETLLFKEPAESADAPGAGDYLSDDDPHKLVWNRNLLEFRARMTAVAQVAEVQVRGWDIKEKEAVIGQADVEATNAEISMSASDLAAKFDGKTMTVVDHPAGDQETADETATARSQQVGSAAFEATAVAIGHPALKAGEAVSIAGVDPALEGKWVITGSRHEFGNGPYRTALEFTGRQDRSIHGLVSQGSAGGGGGMQRYYGVAVAIVTDNKDPDTLGRVKLSYPWLSDDAESSWARLVAPGAGLEYGVIFVPQVGDEVLVAFDHGDINFPIVLGGLWNGKDTIPFDYDGNLDAGKVTYCGLVSRSGHALSFYESDSKSSIQIQTAKSKFNIELDETNQVLKIEADGKLTIDVKQDVEIKAGGSMKLEATGQMTIKGATVAIN